MNKYVMKLTNDFFRAQNRQGVLQDQFSKTAACCLGQQPSSKIWVMNNHVQLDAAGEQISNEDSPYMWLGNLHPGNGKTIAFVEDQALVMHPDQKQTAMDTLLKVLKETVKDNFIPAFLYLGGAAMASHYEAIFQVQSMCPTPVAIGSKNTGKTTAANTALGMLGMPAHFHIRDTTDVEASEQMERKTFPSILDDPDDMKTVKRIVNNSFNCTTQSTTRGSTVPKTGNLIAINTEKLISLCSNFK